MELLNAQESVRGRVQPFRIFPCGSRGDFGPRKDGVHLYRLGRQERRLRLPGDWVAQGIYGDNQVMYQWASIVGQLLCGSPSGKAYNLAAMYLEFHNGEPTAPPTIADRTDARSGLGYYQTGMAANYDYLRVPMTSVILSSTDDDNYPDGNLITCFAQTGVLTAGPHGLTFGSAASSYVIGGALVATPQFSDPTQDMVFSRFYFSEVGQQLPQLTTSQIGLKWPIQLS